MKIKKVRGGFSFTSETSIDREFVSEIREKCSREMGEAVSNPGTPITLSARIGVPKDGMTFYLNGASGFFKGVLRS